MACGDDAPSGSGPSPTVEGAPALTVPDRGDPLLAAAREGIRDGAVPSDSRSQILDSTAPAHARARRVLMAMDEPLDAEPPDDPQATVPPPSIPVSAETAGAAADRPSSKSNPPSPDPVPSAPATTGNAKLGTVSLRSSKRGATLILGAPSSLVVGVANQPHSGIVRLIIESAKAGGRVLSARPKIDGAAVTAVRQGQGTVQITLQLEPGWRLGSVNSVSRGAKVQLIAPG